MKRRVIAAIVFAWIVSLVSVAVWAQSGRAPSPTNRAQPLGNVITGADVGFQRFASGPMNDGQRVVGRWMVKVDGRWRETEAPIGLR